MFTVIKRNGDIEKFDFEKINKVYNICANNLDKIDKNEFIEEFNFRLKNNIKTSEIQETLIKTSNNLVYKNDRINIQYSILSNRFYLFDFWKRISLQREYDYYSNFEKHKHIDFFGHFKDSNMYYQHLNKMVSLGYYDDRLLEIPKDIILKTYTYMKNKNKYDEKQKIVKHFMWNNYFYQSIKFEKSYILNKDNKIIETFDEALILISLIGFLNEYKKHHNKEKYIEDVIKFYEYLTSYHIIPATPQLLNLRTSNKNIASCYIMDVNDNIESIFYTIYQSALISKNAGGIGIYAGKIRPSNSSVNGVNNISNHINSWLKFFNQVAVAVNQGGKRKGSITIAIPIWHKDVLEFIESKNPLMEEALRLFDIFPQVIIPSFFFDFANNNDSFYLIDIYEVNKIDNTIDLINKKDDDLRKDYYKVIDLIKNNKIKNYIKIENARDLLIKIIEQQQISGLPYIVYEDNLNKYSPFNEKIYSVNLCVESFSPFKNTNPEKQDILQDKIDIGYIHTCSLISLHLPKLYEDGILFNDEKLDELLNYVIRYMDNTMELGNYPVPEAINHIKRYRTIGIGYLGLQDLFVKLSLDNGKLYTYRYTKRNVDKTYIYDILKKIFGRISFYSMKNSIYLSKDRGKPIGFEYTKWKDGILFGRYKINYDNLETIYDIFGIDDRYYDLAKIREMYETLLTYGIRNTMLLNAPPNTSTSIYAGTTASILPTYKLINKEEQKSYSYITFPKYLSDETKFLYDVYSNYISIYDYIDIIDIISFIQQYIDSGISFEIPINHNLLNETIDIDELCEYLNIDKFKYYNNKTMIFDIPVVDLILYFIINYSFKKGIKTIYYIRNIVDTGNRIQNNDCVGCAN